MLPLVPASEPWSAQLTLQLNARVATLVRRFGGSAPAAVAARRVAALRPIDDAGPSDLAPLLSRRFLKRALDGSCVLLVDASLAELVPAQRRWAHPQAARALAELLAWIEARLPRPRGARVHRTARVARGAVVLPGAVVGPDARVEPNAVVYGRVHVGARVVVGAGAVVGRPGFGWTAGPDGALARIPQLGGVVLEDDVELGPLCTIDAGTLSPTRIGRGAKLDAAVHVGHNAVVGAGALVAAQAGFAGSTRLGPGVMVGGQAGVADHVTIGAGARLAAKAGVVGDVAPGAVVAGYPAVDRARWLRATARSLRAADRRDDPSRARPRRS